MDSKIHKLRVCIDEMGRGSVFIPADFSHLGNGKAIPVYLSRLVDDGVIRRLARGIYEFPLINASGQLLPPDCDEIAFAMARRTNDNIIIADIGDDVSVDRTPGCVTYLTTGLEQKIQVGDRLYVLKKPSAELRKQRNQAK